MTERRSQRGGDHSTNVQAQVVQISGPTYTEVREIALDVFRANILTLSDQARATARERAEELIDEFVGKLRERNPDGAETVSSPEMQYSIFSAARDYARSSLDHHREMLSNLLVEKTRTEESSLESIVVAESVEAVRKITTRGADALTAIFCFLYLRDSSASTLDDVVDFYRRSVFPWVEALDIDSSTHDALAHAGCLRVDASTLNPVRVITGKNPGIFHEGIHASKVDKNLAKDLVRAGWATYEANGTVVRLLIQDFDQVAEATEAIGKPEKADAVRDAFLGGMPEDNQLAGRLSVIDGRFGPLISAFSKAPLTSDLLTNVGLAVAHSNWARTVPDPPPLSEWL